MVPYNQVVNGVTRYIDSEIVSKLTGWQRWAIGAGLGIAVSKGSHIMEQMRSIPMVKMLNIIDGDMVDIETIYSELRKQAGLSSATFTKLRKNQEVTLGVMLKIAEVMQCNAGDMMDFLPDDKVEEDVE